MISDQYPPILGGTERQAEKLCREMARRGHSVRVVTGRWKRDMPAFEKEECGVEVYRVATALSMLGIRGLRKFGQDVFAHSLRVKLEELVSTADVFHVHFVRRAAAVALEISASTNIPVIVKETSSGLNNSFFTLPYIYRGRYLRDYFLRNLRHVAVLNATAESEYRSLPFENLTVHRAINGIEMENLPRWTPSQNPKQILFLGRIRAVKGALTLLEAFAKVIPQRPGWKLRFCGEGDGTKKLRAKVQQLSLGNLCEVVGRTDRPLKELSKAALVVIPSVAEGMSNTLIEAMAVGAPTVATSVGANSEMLLGDCGWLVPELTVDALANAILVATKSDEERERRGARARTRAKSTYSIQEAARRYEEIYDAIGAKEVR